MIAADTSTWIEFLKGSEAPKAGLLGNSLREGTLLMPSPVLMELLSFPALRADDRELLRLVPRVDPKEGYWERAAETRASLLRQGLKARSMDCLIAQCCLDADIPLIADDLDYRHFPGAGLRLL